MRDLLNIFILSLSKAAKLDDESTGRIEAFHVVEAAHQWFERDKLHSIADKAGKALSVFEKQLIGERRTRFFAVPSDVKRTDL
jgi:hypothetical protein